MHRKGTRSAVARVRTWGTRVAVVTISFEVGHFRGFAVCCPWSSVGPYGSALGVPALSPNGVTGRGASRGHSLGRCPGSLPIRGNTLGLVVTISFGGRHFPSLLFSVSSSSISSCLRAE